MRERILSVPWSWRDGLVVYLIPWIVLPLIALIWMQLLAPFNDQVAEFTKAFYDSDPRAIFGFIMIDTLGSMAILAYYLHKYRAKISDLGIRKFNVPKAILGIVATAVAFYFLLVIVLYVVSSLFPGFNPDEAQTNEFIDVAPEFKLYSLLALIVIPPIVEEVVFRGFIFPAFAKKWGILAGAVISSLLFGIAHLQANVSIYTLLLGLLLCMLYVRFGSIMPGIALHMINNYIAYISLGQQ